MLAALILAVRTALIQIMLSMLTTPFMKELIITGLKKLVTHTDNDVDDKIVSMIDDAVHGRLNEQPKICPKCQAVLD